MLASLGIDLDGVRAAQRQRAAIDPAGLLLGMVEVEGLSNRLLRDVGVSPEDVRAALQAAS